MRRQSQKRTSFGHTLESKIRQQGDRPATAVIVSRGVVYEYSAIASYPARGHGGDSWHVVVAQRRQSFELHATPLKLALAVASLYHNVI